MKKTVFLIVVVLFIICCQRKKIEPKDVIGIYVGNGPFFTDTIKILPDSIYIHYGKQLSLEKSFSDTGKYKVMKNEILFSDFCFYNAPDEFLTEIKGNWFSKTVLKKNVINLTISSEQKYFYKKISEL